MFAGYPWRYDPILGETDPARFEQRYYEVWSRLTSDMQRSELLSDQVLRGLARSSPRDGFNAALADTADLDPLHRALRFEAENFLQGVLSSRGSTEHGLFCRSTRTASRQRTSGFA